MGTIENTYPVMATWRREEQVNKPAPSEVSKTKVHSHTLSNYYVALAPPVQHTKTATVEEAKLSEVFEVKRSWGHMKNHVFSYH